MGSAPPKIIKDVFFLGHEVLNCQYSIIKDPEKKKSGYINTNVKHKLKFDIKDTIRQFSLFEMNAFVGIADKQNETDPHIFTLTIELLTRYTTKDSDSTQNQLKRYDWYFNSHAMILMHNITRDIMKDTRFRMFETIKPF